jgi:hypothetical protein
LPVSDVRARSLILIQKLITHPLEDVVPSHGKTPGRIDEADRIGVETTGDGEQDGQFTEGVDDVDHHLGLLLVIASRIEGAQVTYETDERETDQESGRTTT